MAASPSDVELDERIKALADVKVDDVSAVYTLGDELGRGRFSVVQAAVHKGEGTRYAIKVVENDSLSDEENLEALETEIKILRQLSHPHIVQLKEVVHTTENTYIVMELLSGGELFNRIVDKGCYPEAEAAELFAQILLSIDYLHSRNIVHRDVKPENILFVSSESSDMKLIDFGYAGLWREDKQLTGLCGTPDYVAPEVLTWYDDDDNGTPYGKGSDLWSLGVLLYVILSGCSPFSADEEELLLKQVAEAKYEFFENEWKNVSANAKDIITRLLVVDPAKRLTMPELLQHPWVKDSVSKCRADIERKLAAPLVAPSRPWPCCCRLQSDLLSPHSG
jgi:calcium/calmodulin-dependent protein kinase I